MAQFFFLTEALRSILLEVWGNVGGSRYGLIADTLKLREFAPDTPRKTKMSPENQWLENVLKDIESSSLFRGRIRSFSGVGPGPYPKR